MSFVVQTSFGTSFPVIEDTVIEGNTRSGSCCGSDGGGGVYSFAFSGTLSPAFRRCVFRANLSNFNGGAANLYRVSGAEFTNCTVDANTAGNLGNIYLRDAGGVTIRGCSITRNTASMGGALVVVGGSTVTVTACTIADNDASTGSAGLLYSGATLTGCIVWGNTGTALSGPQGTVQFSNLQSMSGLTGGGGPTNISLDPLFIDPGAGDYHLASSSPCVDAGPPGASGLPMTDLDGTPRVANGIVDVGADEVPAASLTGTGEDLDLYTWVDGVGDPHAESTSATGGNVLSARLATPAGVFVGAPPLLLGQVFPASSPPAPFPLFPAVRIDPTTPFVVVVGTLIPPPFPSPGLPPSGIEVFVQVPPGLGGNAVRFQAFAITTYSAIGMFAASRAHDIVLQ